MMLFVTIMTMVNLSFIFLGYGAMLTEFFPSRTR
jgi:hypothetical protein